MARLVFVRRRLVRSSREPAASTLAPQSSTFSIIEIAWSHPLGDLLAARLQYRLNSGIVCGDSASNTDRQALPLKKDPRTVIPVGSARLVGLADRQECSSPDHEIIFLVVGVGFLVPFVRPVQGIDPLAGVTSHVQHAVRTEVSNRITRPNWLPGSDVRSFGCELVSPGVLTFSMRYRVPRRSLLPLLFSRQPFSRPTGICQRVLKGDA